MTERFTSFHNASSAVSHSSWTISCRARQHNWGSAKSALHLTLNLCTFLLRRCVMNKRRNPFRSWQVSGAKPRTWIRAGDANANTFATKDEPMKRIVFFLACAVLGASHFQDEFP